MNPDPTPSPSPSTPPAGETPIADCSPKRSALHASRGKPVLGLDFEVFASGEVSMWTHFDHAMPFHEAKAHLEAIQAHLAKFIRDRAMCPFHKPEQPTREREKTETETDHPYSYMRWHRLSEVTDKDGIVELYAASSCDGIPVIAQWRRQIVGWSVEAMDGEGSEWRTVCLNNDEEECVPMTPPAIWSDELERRAAYAERDLAPEKTKRLIAERERSAAESERDALRAALEKLVTAKDEKNAHGDTPVYQALKAGAWEAARAALTPTTINEAPTS